MKKRPQLQVVPLSLKAANAFVVEYHRHHKPVPGAKFALGAWNGRYLVGVGIAGRPVSRHLDNGSTLEVNRTCTDGTRNANSFLYGAIARVAREMGYQRLLTYTLPEELGASLRAVGWTFAGEAGGGQWSCPSRPRQPSVAPQKKWRWEISLNESLKPLAPNINFIRRLERGH
jgi:hypothetical protein